jgi:ATPase subunit of ABC transporter with duplicated ATPase domains
MIDLVNISLQFNGKYLFRDSKLSESVPATEISLVGANGTGKTSILRIINTVSFNLNRAIFTDRKTYFCRIPCRRTR